MTRAAFDLSANQGAAVLSLMERALIPPVPAFYRLFFDYVAGAKSPTTERVGEIISAGEEVRDKLYTEFIAPYENSETLERAIEQMVRRLTTLDGLMVQSADATADHSRSLAMADEHLSNGANAELLRDLIGRLQLSTERMRKAQLALDEELLDAQTELIGLRASIAQSREVQLRDPLTGVANRSGVDFALAQLIEARAGALGQLSIAVLDIDHFKALNDGYGHQVGDDVLRIVTGTLRAASRGSDIVGRHGGDEFVVVMPGTGLAGATDVAENLRKAVAEADIAAAVGPGVLGGVTISIGVAEFRHGDTRQSFVERADRCLYRAKGAGRNRVEARTGG